MKDSQKIEAVLFWKGEPMTLSAISKVTDISPKNIPGALKELEERLLSGGLCLVQRDEEVAIGTRPETSSIIESLAKEELRRDIGNAGLEVLSIILYLSPVGKSRVDHIRGVSSTFTVRNLLIRGLIERVSAEGIRGHAYRPTLELLSHLGLSKLEDLPDYVSVREEILNREKRVSESEEKEGESVFQKPESI
ncbi:MAG: SMC-Scp complex subunit ScpB [Patescibacteria group bacterium]